MLRTVKTLSLAAAVLMMAAGASASTLTIRLEADPAGAGQEYDIRVYATVAGTGDLGVFATSINLVTPDSEGLTEPIEKFPPPASGKVKTTWSAEALSGLFTLIEPSRKATGPLHGGADLDSDLDAIGLGFTDTTNFANTSIGVTETLIATLRWKMAGAGQTRVEAWVDPASAHYDWGNPPGYFTQFTEVVGDSVLVGEGGVNQDPTADADGPYLEAQWQYHEGGPGGRDYNFIVLDGSGSDDPDGDTLGFLWDLTGPDGVPWGVTGEQVTLEGNEFLAHGYVMWQTYDITLTVDDGKGGTDTATTQLQVPEPGTMLLLGLGAVGCLLRRRRA